MVSPDESYVPALRFRALTRVYDPVARLTVREAEFKRRLIHQAGLAQGADVLDLGCGTGTLALMAAARGARVTGVDGDPAVLAQARAKAARAGSDVRFDEALSFDLPYSAASFDRVLSSLFFHHLTTPDKLRTLGEVRRVLRPGGELHVADWGRPRGVAMRVAALGIRLLDGAEPTRDNLAGRLPEL
ncbi:MAG: hypothetical protein QOJ07_996, partial [Thermoleophilaceae bacterium]|nr:hypothetical protein [Thermoleophilaceae bacterium]